MLIFPKSKNAEALWYFQHCFECLKKAQHSNSNLANGMSLGWDYLFVQPMADESMHFTFKTL